MIETLIERVTETSVRLLRDGEHVPLDVGFTRLDPDWTWVQTDDGVITAVFLACPCHGMVQFVHVKGKPKPSLLRKVVRDCIARGYIGYTAFFSSLQEKEVQFMEIMEKAGAKIMPDSHVCLGGFLKDLGEW